jgi:hypothetical protein
LVTTTSAIVVVPRSVSSRPRLSAAGLFFVVGVSVVSAMRVPLVVKQGLSVHADVFRFWAMCYPSHAV